MSSGERNAERDADRRADTRNPCDGTCRFDPAGECRGCHRTKPEVKGWKRLSDAAKAAINQRLRARHAPPKSSAKPGAKRLRKLDRKIGKLEARLDALRAERESLAGPSPAGRADRPSR